jgi:NOL1/NOP2/fmu family ribosome biogenesis protein
LKVEIKGLKIGTFEKNNQWSQEGKICLEIEIRGKSGELVKDRMKKVCF